MNYLGRILAFFKIIHKTTQTLKPSILTPPLRELSHYPLMRFFILDVFFQFTLFDIGDKLAIALFFHVF
ncbi:hypothetical protein VN1266_02330 [Helicobacter pylori]|nr:hypothetical protein VN1266_02330 [Helicobacter pylori]GHS07076.1 hypothetical protein VN1283_14610 [Helicobacter pylori]